MSVDDYNQRVKDYWNRRNKEIDAQLDAEAAARSRENDRLLSGEELKTKYSVRPGGDAGGPNKTEPTAEEQFNEHSKRLFVELKYSTFLPNNITQEWVREIEEIKKCSASEGLKMLDMIFLEYRHARYKYKPQRDIWGLAFYKESRYNKEMDRIKHELDWLEVILKHAEAYWKKNPSGVKYDASGSCASQNFWRY